EARGLTPDGVDAAELKIEGVGAPPIDVHLDVVDGRAAFRSSLGLHVGDTFEIVSVQLIVSGGATLVPGVGGGSGDDDDQGEDGDGDGGHDGDDDHSLTRHDDGGGDGGDDDGGGYSSTLVKAGSGGFDFDSSGGAHVSIGNDGRVRFEVNGV